MAKICFFVPGKAKAQPRPRFWNDKVIAIANPETKKWKEKITEYSKVLMMDQETKEKIHAWCETGINLQFIFVFKSPNKKSIGLPHLKKPDADNLAKLAMDAMADAGVFIENNDSLVYSLTCSKVYGEEDQLGVIILIDGWSGNKLDLSRFF